MDPGLVRLRRTLEAIAPVGEQEWRELRPQVRSRGFAQTAHLQHAGEPSENVFFLASGLVREYYMLANGTERIRNFVPAGRFTAAYADFILDRAAEVSIQALQETEALLVPLRAFVELRRKNPVWEIVGRRLLEEMYVQKEKREFQFLTMSAGERYARLRVDLPGIEETVSQYHLASYLGITPVALSRIRGRRRPQR